MGPERLVRDVEAKSPEFAATYQARAKGFRLGFPSLDHGHKGYLTREDMLTVYTSQFRAADVDRKGYLTKNQF